MKRKILNLVLTTTMVIAVSGASSVGAGEYLGDFCWQQSSGGKTRDIRAGVTDVGGGHYLLTGTYGPPGSPFPMHGNAELIDGMVLINVNWVFTDDAHISTRHAFMSLDGSLNGTITGMKKQVDISSGDISRGKWEAPISFVPCE